jgi:hypothetical protein
MDSILQDLANLGPALGSVTVIGIICWKLLQLFDKHGDAIKNISETLHGQTEMLKQVDSNVQANTRATDRVAMLLERGLK